MENNRQNLLVSVIVPVYNTEKYLEKCVNSILSQTYTNLEVILVDDGSKDASGSICDAFAEKDGRVKVIHKENGGQSSARNMALDVFAGDYVAFIDSDDYVKSDMIEQMMSYMLENDADLSVCGFATELAGKIFESELGEENKVVSNHQLMYDYVATKDIRHILCNKIHHRSFFDDIRFPEGMIHEDVYTVHRIIGQCKRAVYLKECLYTQYERVGSTTQATVSERDLSLLVADEELHRYYLENYPDLAEITATKKGNDAANLMERIYRDFRYSKNKELFAKFKKVLSEEYEKHKDKLGTKALKAMEKPFLFRMESRYFGIRRKIGIVVKKMREKK